MKFLSIATFFTLMVYSVSAVEPPSLNDMLGTPDGLPPALETICEQYEGTARGLCISFCEAKDCDTTGHPSCDKIKENFVKITGQASLPCEVRCPCWDQSVLDAINANSVVLCRSFELYGYEAIFHRTVYGFEGLYAIPLGASKKFDVDICSAGILTLEVTEKELAICMEQIRAKCAEVEFEY